MLGLLRMLSLFRCRACFMREVTMAIYRKTRDEHGNRVRQSDFSCYPIGLTGAVYNDTLAQMIVDSWVDSNFRDGLLNKPRHD
jgi:hypothetical protein